MSDTSGPSLPEPLAFYDPDSSSWRMSAGTFPWEPPPSLETLPPSGMTLSGVLYELPMSAPAIAVPGCSSLPTPTTEPMTGNGHARNLGKEVTMLPTPSAIMDAEGTTYRNHRASSNFETNHAVTLGQVAYRRVHELLPTPEASDGTGGRRSKVGGTTAEAIGELTAPPSPAMPLLSDDLLLTLWTTEDD